MDDKVTEFRGRQAFHAWLEAVDQVEGGTISPGGGAQLLGYTRQAIHNLITRGHVRAWVFYEDRVKPATYIEIAVRDLLAHGVRTGRIRSEDDCGVRFPSLSSELKELLTT